MTNAVETFVITQNIVHYKKLLQGETDPDKRSILLRLLKNEIRKLPAPEKRAEMRRLICFQ